MKDFVTVVWRFCVSEREDLIQNSLTPTLQHYQARSRGGGGLYDPPPPSCRSLSLRLRFCSTLYGFSLGLAWGPIKVTIPSSYRWKYAPLWLINHCECPRVGVFFNFSEGGWRHADNVQGGVLLNVFTPPSGNPVSAPASHLSKFRPPPPPGWLATGLMSTLPTLHCTVYPQPQQVPNNCSC